MRDELRQRLLAKPLGVGRVQEHQVEGRAGAGRARSEVGGVAAVDAGAAEQVQRLDIVADGAAGGLVGLDEQAEGGAIRDNVEALHLFGCTRIHRRDATDLGPRPASAGAPFDLVFLDPPYGKGLGEKALAELLAHGWLQPRAILVFERGAEEPDPITPGYERLDARAYGAARLLFLRLAGL